MQLYYSDEARVNARERIAKLLIKLENTPPSKQLTAKDIHALRHYLGTLDDALVSELRRSKAKKMKGD